MEWAGTVTDAIFMWERRNQRHWGTFLVAEAQHHCLGFELDAPDGYERCGPR